MYIYICIYICIYIYMFVFLLMLVRHCFVLRLDHDSFLSFEESTVKLGRPCDQVL
jgi:hypothetical protein